MGAGSTMSAMLMVFVRIGVHRHLHARHRCVHLQRTHRRRDSLGEGESQSKQHTTAGNGAGTPFHTSTLAGFLASGNPSRRRVDDELPIQADSYLVVAYSDSFVGAVHASEIRLSESNWQEPENAVAEPTVVPGVRHHDDQIGRDDYAGNYALNRALEDPETVRVCARNRRRLRRKRGSLPNVDARIIDHTTNVLNHSLHAVARQNPEVHHRPRATRKY